MHNSFVKLIKEFNTIIIYRHTRPDGDALGSQFGLKEIIKTNFPNKKVYAVGDMTKKYSFMGEVDILDEDQYNNSLGIVLDSSEKSLVSDDHFLKSSKLIKIDHHIYREKFGDLEIVDDSYESCCGLVADLMYKSKMKISSNAAKQLYTGIITDSGRFRYDSTSARTFEICSKLLKEGFDLQDIYNNLYTEDLNTILLRAKYTLKMQFTKNNVAYIVTTKEELAQENVDVFTISRSIVGTMSGIKNVEIWANFTEDVSGNCVYVEIRSNKYNINPIAVKYGGGGHAKASGATVKDLKVVEEILKDLDEMCGE